MSQTVDMDALNKTIAEAFKQHAGDIIGQEHAFSLGYKIAHTAALASLSHTMGVNGLEAFNINESVHVKLSDEGRAILAERHAELCRRTKMKLSPHVPKAEDAEGYSTFQLWDLMNTFGPHLWLGNPRLPFDAEIRFDVDTSNNDEPGEHQEVLDAIAAHNSGEEE